MEKKALIFLGMHYRRLMEEESKGGRYRRTYQYPSKGSMKKMRATIKGVLGKRNVLYKDVKSLVEEMNPKIRGWRNYYGLKTSRKWLQSIEWYMIRRFTIWYNKKKQKRNHLRKISLVKKIVYENGLIYLPAVS